MVINVMDLLINFNMLKYNDEHFITIEVDSL